MAITKITISLNQTVRRLACLLVSVVMSFALLGQTDSMPQKFEPRECYNSNKEIAADSFCMLYRDSLPVIVDRIQRKMGTDADFRLFARLYNTIKLNQIHVFCGPHLLGGKDVELEKLESFMKIVLDANRPTDYYRLGHFYTRCREEGSLTFMYVYTPSMPRKVNTLTKMYNKFDWLAFKRSKLMSPDGKCRSVKCKIMQFSLFWQRNWLLMFRRMHL